MLMVVLSGASMISGCQNRDEARNPKTPYNAHIAKWAINSLLGDFSIPPGKQLGEVIVNAGERNGYNVVNLPWPDVQARIKKNRPFPVLLTVDENNCCVLTDIVNHESKNLYLIAFPGSLVKAFPEDEFLSNNWERAVWATPDASAAREVVVGDAGKAVIDHIWHSFGITTPFKRHEALFHLTNTSDEPLRIDQIGTSCGCTSVKNLDSHVILPGSTVTIPVYVETDAKQNLYQEAYVTLSKPRHPEEILLPPDKAIVTLRLVGWQPQSMDITPMSVDFGPVKVGQVAESEIRMVETTADLFSIKSIEAQGIPVTSRIEIIRDDHPRYYLIKLRADTSHMKKTGKNTGTLLVKTTSRFRPTVEIPVNIIINNQVTAQPSVIELSENNHAANQILVHISHAESKSLRGSVIEKPGDIVTKLEHSSTGLVLKVWLAPQSKTIKEPVKVNVEWDGGVENIELPCFYFANP